VFETHIKSLLKARFFIRYESC